MVEKIEKIALSHSEIFLREDGIVEILIKEASNIGVNQCKEIMASYKTILEPKKYPLLHLVEDYVVFERSAREFSASPDGMLFSKAEAYVITSLAHKLLANFYLKVNKPPVPTKFFRTKEEAIDWLNNFM